jgi:hypothetical protein
MAFAGGADFARAADVLDDLWNRIDQDYAHVPSAAGFGCSASIACALSADALTEAAELAAGAWFFGYSLRWIGSFGLYFAARARLKDALGSDFFAAQSHGRAWTPADLHDACRAVADRIR